MKIGIKYCGGCNPHYDRTREVQKFIKKFPNHTFTFNPEQDPCDICLLVCGCMTACASREHIATTQFKELCTPRQFVEFRKELENTSASLATIEKKSIHIGDTASMTKTFTLTDIQQFAALTGDFGKLHTDSVFAATYGFGRPVVHGVLVGSLISSIMGMELPGAGTILMDEKLTFLSPVYPGDTITASIKVTSITEKKRWYIGEFYGQCINQDGITVVEGTIHQVMNKTLFTCTF